MSVIGSSILAGASGAAGGGKVYVDDVFSTFLYEGDAVGGADTQTINNGIDLAGEGGLVWVKNRNTSSNEHILTDTERGATKYISSNQDSGESTGSNHLNLFNNNGFRVGSDDTVNKNTEDFVSWTFRKAPGFFDVVTYAGNQTAGRQVAHNLGSVPGMIIVKRTDGVDDWFVYHRELGNNQYVRINKTLGQAANDTLWSATTPTSTHFTVGANPGTNWNGRSYVAYIFAHDDQSFGTDSDESIIKCGIYTGTGSGGNRVELGFEPQFLMLKSASYSDSNTGWFMLDTMRAFNTSLSNAVLLANESAAENPTNGAASISGSGFELNFGGEEYNKSGATYIYIAIRRPHKPPEAATDVFAIDTGNSSSTIPAFDSGFPVDFAFRLAGYASGGNNPRALSRLMGGRQLYTSLANAQSGVNADVVWDSMSGYEKTFTSNDIAWMFKRAPGFMDVVAYSGNSSNQNVSHNLGVAPEFYIVKRRSGSEDWATYAASLGANKYTKLNQDAATYTNTTIWNNTSPTTSTFTVGNDVSVNGSGDTYIAYLFATLPDISKVGTYSGYTSNAVNVNCGFTAGARFILIKRTDSTGDWYLYDTLRGIVSGNDPYILINTSTGQQTGTDYIDPLSTGFTVTASAPAALNATGGTYLFLAIA